MRPHGCVHGYIRVLMDVTLCLYVLVGPCGSGAGAQLYLGQSGKGVTGTQSPLGSGQPASLPPPPQLDTYLMVRFSEMENLPEKLLEGWFNNMISPGLKPDNTFS